MSTITMPDSAADQSFLAGSDRDATPALSASGALLDQDELRRLQLLARLTGLLFLITYATSIPAALWLYVPAALLSNSA